MADVEEESALVPVTGGYIDYICAALYPFWNLAGYKLKINKNRFISTFQVYTKFGGGSRSASLSPLSQGSRYL